MGLGREATKKKKKANYSYQSNLIDLRKLRKRLRLLGLNKTWINRVIFPIKFYRKRVEVGDEIISSWGKSLAEFSSKISVKRQFLLIKIGLLKKRKRGRPKKSHKKKKSFSVKRKSGVIFYSNHFRNALNYYRNRPGQVFLSFLFSLVLFSGSYLIYERILGDLPMPHDLVEKEQIVTTRILDRNGEVLFRIYKDENRTLVPFGKIPQHVRDATVAIEDKNFYKHHGFSVIAILRALNSNLKGERVQGGSTITQQLVKNRLLTPERTLERKIREVIVAVLVEGTFTKDEILEMYFNEIAYGGAIYGIEEASQKYFGKSVSDLSLAEAALLVGLPAAPSEYTPFGSNPELAYVRQQEVLRRMVEDGYITDEQAQEARAQKLQFNSDSIEIKAPHFVMYVKELLAEKYGEDLVNQGGLEVRTTLDLDLHNEAVEVIEQELASLERLNVKNGAALVTNPRTGEILSMVGSKNYFDFSQDGQVNVTLRPRQPGSSIKPITYALALESGKNLISLLQDSPITYQVVGSPPYSPKNYDGKYHGNVTLKQALASSYNIPAVKLLAELGVERMIDKAELMGISTWKDRERFGLSLTLGGGEVLMTDMAEVYGSFANNGYRVDLNPILEVRNVNGETLYRNKCALDGGPCNSVLSVDPRVAFLISHILSDNLARSSAFGLFSVLNIPGQQVAVKTGTTNSLRDNWTFGYTSDRVVAVWVGNNDNSTMSNVASGITGASPIWNKIMRLNLSEQEPHKFASPSGVVAIDVCAKAGTLPCNNCPVTKEFFIYGTEPRYHCSGESFSGEGSGSTFAETGL